jgi:hypothetical protein
MITKENSLRGTTTDAGQTVEIIKADGSVMKPLGGGPFAWGPQRRESMDKMVADNVGRINLAKALLAWTYGGPADPRVTQYFTRYQHRVVLSLGKDWALRAADVRQVLDAIIATERETAQSRAMVDMTPAPVVTERGGLPGAPIIWDTNDAGQRVTKPGE